MLFIVIVQTSLNITSKLQYSILWIAKNVNNNAVLFKYANQALKNNDWKHFIILGRIILEKKKEIVAFIARWDQLRANSIWWHPFFLIYKEGVKNFGSRSI